ncbi:pseudouridine synthase deg1 [Sorochytrium milnesiophthora]
MQHRVLHRAVRHLSKFKAHRAALEVRAFPRCPRPLPKTAVTGNMNDDQATVTTTTTPDYSRWTREQLLQRVQELEQSQLTLDSSATGKQQASATKKVKPSKAQRKQHTLRPFDFSQHPSRQVVFRVAYFGWLYHGYASQAHTQQTVEHHLFQALSTVRLVDDIKAANYSRCGRTDKGVSATGNAFSVRVRSAVRAPGDVELPYLTMLNRTLPDHIRVVAWAPVPDDFTARFSCTSRTYKYYFPALGLDVRAMQQAVAKFVGTHDFRNFCKIDPNKPIRNYERTILEAFIEPAHEGVDSTTAMTTAMATAMTTLDGTTYHYPHAFYTLTIKGTAFLWHQIRCMVHVMLLIGQKLEQPAIIDELLDVQTNPQKPQYDMAPELPLVFWDSEFTGVQWRYWDDDGKDYFNGTDHVGAKEDSNKRIRLAEAADDQPPSSTSHNDQDDDADASAHFYMAISGQIKHLVTMYESHKLQTLVIDRLLKDLFAARLPTVSSSLPPPFLAAHRPPAPATTSFTELLPYALAARPPHVPWGVHGCLFPVVGRDVRRKKEQGTYTPLMQRPKCDSVAEKDAKHAVRQARGAPGTPSTPDAVSDAAAAAGDDGPDDDQDE